MKEGQRLRGGIPCPSGEAHGPLVDLPGSDKYHCPHSAHTVGQPTKNVWTVDEVAEWNLRLRRAGGMR